ncbi:hypothetical protein [Pelagibius sp.]
MTESPSALDAGDFIHDAIYEASETLSYVVTLTPLLESLDVISAVSIDS